MKLSFITTVFNEEKTISTFLESLLSQTKKIHEIIIVDGGSSDETELRIKNYESRIKAKKITLTIITKKGNRSVGRNEAIKHATGDIILCSDAGNVLDKKWVEKITEPFADLTVDVVAGYYKGKITSVFQKCLVPYVLVMPDKVNPRSFLPATRSIAFRKAVWKRVGKFPEEYSHNEDYVFAKKLEEMNAKIVFVKEAVVYWFPRTTLKQSFIMFSRFAFGDAEAGILRTKVLLVFSRYFLGLYLLFLSILYKNSSPLLLCLFAFFCYILWSIKKNYRYVKEKKALILLPILQLTSDVAVLLGTFLGLMKRIGLFNYIRYINNNFSFLVICLIYVILMLLTIHSGAPNRNHPYPYNMDEWHQLHAMVETFKNGTPNTAGAANGTLFHFLLSGFYVIPFVLTNYINVSEMRVFDLDMRARVFEVLRFSTIVWGIASIFVLGKISKLLNISKKISSFLFVFSPLWLSLSGYFKYDIGLMFWLLLSILFILRFAKSATYRDYLIACIFSGLAFSVKVSVIPLLPILVIAYFWFSKEKIKNVKYFIIGLSLYASVIVLFGMPDMVFGKGNILDYLINNILQTPGTTSLITFGMNPWVYLFTRHYPIIFGPGLIFLTLISLGIIIWRNFARSSRDAITLFILVMCGIFILSIVPLQILGGGNRSLVVLPFFVLISGIGLQYLFTSRYTLASVALVIIVGVIQLYSSFAMLSIKILPSPQEKSSSWIIKLIPKGTQIGIENIPIYQGIPDILQKEFYFTQSGGGRDNKFLYQVVDSKTKKLPSVIVITNDEIDKKYLTSSPKKDLVMRLEDEKYRRIAVFYPDLRFYRLSGFDYTFSWLIPSPYSTSIYIK